jgi:hypothetical protein
MGDLLLTEKEAAGLVVQRSGAIPVPRPKWAIVGKVCSPRRLVIGALERSMERAWGLHRQAQFREIGDNRFVVRFLSEGDWKHVMKNGPWQFDFHAVLLKEYDGSIRPSDMVFDTMEIWVRVLDLPMDMMNSVYGEMIGSWVGRYISVDVDDDGMAWGKELRIRVVMRVDQPLPRGIPLKDSDSEKDSQWFDIKYERIPHFCFDCGCLVHGEDGCQAERVEVKQWGEWLRASPRKLQKAPSSARPSTSSSSFGSKFEGSVSRPTGGVSIRDLPPRRKLSYGFENSGSSRTGGHGTGDFGDVTSPPKDHRVKVQDRLGGKAPVAPEPTKKGGRFVRKPRNPSDNQVRDLLKAPLGALTKKRNTRQVWLPVPIRVVGEDSSESAEKRRRTTSVFDRLDDPSADPARQGRREQ